MMIAEVILCEGLLSTISRCPILPMAFVSKMTWLTERWLRASSIVATPNDRPSFCKHLLQSFNDEVADGALVMLRRQR